MSGIFLGMGMRMGMGDAATGRCRCRAFTMVELVVVIGIVMILIGIMIPALGKTRQQAIRTRDLASIRGAFLSLSQYTADNNEYYPVGGDNQVLAVKLWYLPLVASGHIDSWRDLGIPSRKYEQSLIGLTQTALTAQHVFVPGAEEQGLFQPVVAQKTSSVRFPSEKGVLFQHYVESPDAPETAWCCTRDAPPVPIAFGDGSAVTRSYTQFDVQPPPELYRGVGMPVIATWFGLGGRDVLGQ